MTTKKKWAIGIGVFLALGLLGSVMDDGKGSTSNENKTESQQSVQTEQKQEEADRQAREQKEKAEQQAREQKEEADRQAREQKEKAEQQANKKKEIAEAGYKKGYEYGFKGMSDVIGNPISISYTSRYGAPTNDEEKELFNIWKENWKKGYDDGKRAR